MSERKPIRTTISQAVDHWRRHMDECGLGVDWTEADTRCWRCHAEGPNVTDPEVMWDWIRAYAVPFYDTFWYMQGMKEYEFIYKRKVEQEIASILMQANVTDVELFMRENYSRLMNQVMDEASVHFGRPYYNAATIAGIFRMLLKKMAKEYNVTFPVMIEETV